VLPIARAVAQQLAPVCQQFFELGLATQWHQAGSVVFRNGDAAISVYLVISGRIRLFQHAATGASSSSSSSSTANKSATTPSGRRTGRRSATAESDGDDSGDDSDYDNQRARQRTAAANECGHEMMEVGRGDTFGETAIFPESEDSIVRRQATAVCVRDSELVRVSHTSFLYIFGLYPQVSIL
jgi:CRP-like cAMP-binding protein